MKLVYSFILCFFICSLSVPAAAQIIKIGYIEFPPLTYTDTEGQPAGAIIDITSKTLQKAGFQWTATSLSTKRLAKMLTNGDIQLWIGLSTLPEFEGKTYVGKSVVKKLTFRAYTIGKKKPILAQEDLIGPRILILRGYSYGGWINFIKNPSNQVKFLEFDSHKSAFRGLYLLTKNNEDCYLLNYKHPSETVLKSTHLEDIQYNEISSFNIHFVVTKQMVEAKSVLDRIEAAFAGLQPQDI